MWRHRYFEAEGCIVPFYKVEGVEACAESFTVFWGPDRSFQLPVSEVEQVETFKKWLDERSYL